MCPDWLGSALLRPVLAAHPSSEIAFNNVPAKIGIFFLEKMKKNIYIYSQSIEILKKFEFFKKKWFSLNPSGKSYKLIKSSNFPYDFTKLAKKIAKTRRKIESSRKSIKNAHT